VLELTGPGTAQTGTVDELGNLLFREVEPGDGWRVIDPSSDPPAAGEPLTVPTLTDHPDASFYESQEIGEGYGYIEMRDGTLLAAMVRLPGPVEEGPYPTVIEYSGYDPASPYEAEAVTEVYGLLGWATVGVNIRGSGCSGGAFDFYEPLQTIDGYDMVEAIAAQDWVYGNHVGMVGVSYSGISQLYVAQTQPPSLAAITPLSVIEDTYRSVVYPGGIYNNGFAKSWGDARQGANDAYGQGWVTRRVEEGDETCDANQLLRSQNRDLTQLAAESAFYASEGGDPLAPRTFVDRITVPTFLAGAWQDEQTGGRFATMLDDFTGTDVFIAHLYNGAHADSLNPESLLAATELLDVYVAERVPRIDPVIRLGAPLLYEEVFGVPMQVPPDRFTSLEEARAALE
ncbi:MAG: CocE/NonD family hydrolase, partial [Actinobacteria bacterium]|nr:CocE/NonD family hydrolase [Actinomycetota bacterium]NIS36618.1 CocE/NonD family hydrolase [Actinomycetota bacterium]NIT98814.1 CocE/NonD family hydrolase [Actinomycetota bacterium]NIU22434.1 CocE/NonD family hydrolase [Actinomycetota bacterium]NIU71113.1 CocE/NonD family hydrolase [Actinomycetota bacterium]